MGLMDSLFGSGKSSFNKEKAIADDTAARAAADQTRMIDTAHAAGQTGPYGSSQYSFDPVTGKPTGVNTQFTGPMADVNNGLLAGLASNTAPGTMQPNFDQYSPENYLKARETAFKAWADPARDAQNEQVRRQMAERGIPISAGTTANPISDASYGNVSDAYSKGLASEFGAAYSAMPAWINQAQTNEMQKAFAPAQTQLGLLQGVKSFLPQAGAVQSNLQATDVMGAEKFSAEANDKAEADRRAAIGNTIKGVAGLAMAPYNPFGPTNLGAAVSGGMGLFNGASAPPQLPWQRVGAG